MIVVGLDLSLTNAGIAVLDQGIPKLLASVGHPGKNGASWAHRNRRIVSQLRAVTDPIIGTNRRAGLWPDLAVIEGPSYGSEFGDQFDRAALWWATYSALAAKRVPVGVVAPGTLKKWATGKGTAKKADVLLAVRRDWPDSHVANHDIADALTLAAMGAHHHGDPLPFPTKERHTTGLEAVQWPC